MKIQIDLRPFKTPNYVFAKKQPKEVGGFSRDGRIDELKWHLSEISEKTLSDLCDEFRAEIFKKAKKKDPKKRK